MRSGWWVLGATQRARCAVPQPPGPCYRPDVSPTPASVAYPEKGTEWDQGSNSFAAAEGLSFRSFDEAGAADLSFRFAGSLTTCQAAARKGKVVFRRPPFNEITTEG